MRRALRVMGSLAGLVAVGVLLAVVALTFSARGQPQVAQQPYPPPQTPTMPAPSPPGTPSLEPYPPPATLTPVPISTPTALPTMTPVPTATPMAVPTPSGPLPPGMKVVYGETDSSAGTTMIWLASTTNPGLRRLLTTIIHKEGYGVQGAVSPDGNKIAYFMIPPGTGERAARTAGGELWVMNSDGTDSHRVADRVGWASPRTMWAPDSRTLTYGRRVPLKNPTGSQVLWRTELHVVTTDATQPRLLLADDAAHDIQTVGWSADGRLFYYARWANLQDRWELWGVDVLSGSTQFQISAPSQNADSPALLPDGDHLIFTILEGEQRALVMLSVDGREQRTIVSGATGDQPINRYTGTWSPDGQSILAHIPPQAEQPARLERIDLRTGQRHTIPTDAVSGDEFFMPRSWSPDGEWLVVLKYPRMQSLAYLMRATGRPMMQIPLTQSSNWVSLLGWTDR